jgi:hypothetical protein
MLCRHVKSLSLKFEVKKYIFAFYLDDPARFALASCARQDGDIQNIPTLSYVSYSYLKSHAVWALYLSHTENEIEKTGGGWGHSTPPPPPRPLRVK